MHPCAQALLHHDTGVLELLKELVRDVPDARIRLRDIGALPRCVCFVRASRDVLYARAHAAGVKA